MKSVHSALRGELTCASVPILLLYGELDWAVVTPRFRFVKMNLNNQIIQYYFSFIKKKIIEFELFLIFIARNNSHYYINDKIQEITL